VLNLKDTSVIVWKEWVEYSFLILLLLGMILSISISNIFLNCLVVFISGMMAGRIIYVRKGKGYYFPTILIIIGFFLGYLIGGVLRFNTYLILNALLISIMFILGVYLGHYIYKNKYLTI